MRYKIVIDGNKFYEIDEECKKKGMKCKEIEKKERKTEHNMDDKKSR